MQPATPINAAQTAPQNPSAATLAHWEKKAPATAQTAQQFPSLEHETRAAVETACAAFHLSRQQQTLRGWACKEDGPLHPLRINRRLACKTADLRKLLGVSA